MTFVILWSEVARPKMEVVRRREGRRRAEADRLASEAAGLRGLVRVFLSGSQTDNAGTNPAQ